MYQCFEITEVYDALLILPALAIF